MPVNIVCFITVKIFTRCIINELVDFGTCKNNCKEFLLQKLRSASETVRSVSNGFAFLHQQTPRGSCPCSSQEFTSFGATKKGLQAGTETDSQLQQLRAFIQEGWLSNITNVLKQLHEFWKEKEDVHVANNLILMGSRLVILSSRRY